MIFATNCRIRNNPGIAFGYLPIQFEEYEEKKAESLCNKEYDREQYIAKMHEEIDNQFLKKFLRNYDISRIKEERVVQSFSIGRKIRNEENTDKRINKEIENELNGLCIRKPKADKTIKKGKNETTTTEQNNKVTSHAHNQHVLNSLEFKERTQEFYKTFAATTLEVDIAKDLKSNKAHFISIQKGNHDMNHKFMSFKRHPFDIKEVFEISDISRKKQKNKYCWKDIAIKRGYPKLSRKTTLIEEPIENCIKKILSPQPKLNKVEFQKENPEDTSQNFNSLACETYSYYCKKRNKPLTRRSVNLSEISDLNQSRNSIETRINLIHKRYSIPRKPFNKSTTQSTTATNVTREEHRRQELDEHLKFLLDQRQKHSLFDYL